MAEFIKQVDEFAPVFFDDAAVLYAHRQRQNALVKKYELNSLNPFSLLDEKNHLGQKKSLEERLTELERVQAQSHSGNRVLHALTRLLVNSKTLCRSRSMGRSIH